MQLQHLIEGYCAPVQAGYVRWMETGSQVRLMEAPLDIAQVMREKIFAHDESSANSKSWIFTSATLGTNASMSWFVDSCGLGGAKLLQVHSPFDYATQACMAIPEHLPKPSEPTHSAAVAELAAHGASMLGGRTLVLTTTLRAMRIIGDSLRQHFCNPQDQEVLVQGQASKHELVQRFCAGNGLGRRGCVLVASASFWEGVDIPGDALQLLIIDKLPFSPPDDPVMHARAQQIQARGGNSFHSFQVPQAAIALKQGMGRLIRSETDTGVLVICDVRLSQMGYGRKMLAALPTMPRITTQEQLTQALRRLTRVSTKGQTVTL